jgi:hypothetical protein
MISVDSSVKSFSRSVGGLSVTLHKGKDLSPVTVRNLPNCQIHRGEEDTLFISFND